MVKRSLYTLHTITMCSQLLQQTVVMRRIDSARPRWRCTTVLRTRRLPRLLRVLADGEVYRVGGTTPIKVDVRIIAATHQDLEKLVQAGNFREDLFHRLNVIRVHLPKLAERREDIPRLMQHFLKRAAKELAVEPKILRPDAEEYLTTLPCRVISRLWRCSAGPTWASPPCSTGSLDAGSPSWRTDPA